MATYAIGDIQGCYDELLHLLELVQFDDKVDTLWIAGDLVNRGSQSLEVLTFLYQLGDRHKIVLGNHDLHLLAASVGSRPVSAKDTFQSVLADAMADELLFWLRQQPLMHFDEQKNIAMLHAGLVPQWSIHQALIYAAEVAQVLRGPEHAALLHSMYGNAPKTWQDELADWDRLRVIINSLTRLRYCTREGTMSLKAKWPPGTQPEDYFPWFAVEGRRSLDTTIVFGHWAALNGSVLGGKYNVFALDTGCVWGGKLRALRLEDYQVFEVDSQQEKVF